MLRVVADANVLISAALARSPNAPSVQTLDAALDGRLELVTSPLLLRELASVLARPRLRKYLTSDQAHRFLADLAGQSTLLTDPPPPYPNAFPHSAAFTDGHLFEYAGVGEVVERLPGGDPAAARESGHRARVDYRIHGEHVDDGDGGRVAPGVP